MADRSGSSLDIANEDDGRDDAVHRPDENAAEAPLVSAEFFDQLEQLYRTSLKGDGLRYWALEGPTVCNQIESIAKRLEAHYRLVKPLAMGGAGIVCLVENLGLSSIEFTNGDGGKHFSVLKLPRPVAGQAQILNRIIYGETTKLLSLNHHNLVRIEFADREESGTYFYVMQLLEHPKDADDAVRESPALSTIVNILRDALAGLQYLHANGIAHLDIKPGNLFATTTHTVVGDLGFAKSVEMPGLTTALGGTRGFQHPDHLSLILEAKNSELDSEDDNRLMNLSETFRDRIKKEWDLYSLGLTMLVLLNRLFVMKRG